VDADAKICQASQLHGENNEQVEGCRPNLGSQSKPDTMSGTPKKSWGVNMYSQEFVNHGF
jgi:hypothetical protein